jgi:ABC-type spermidine/putrescine transport system permease subunit II
MARTFPWVAALVFALVALLPIAYLVSISFLDRDGTLTTEYYQVYTSGALWHLLWRSVLLAGGAALLALLVGVPAGILLGRTDLKLKPM